jgi:hypothetical protein
MPNGHDKNWVRLLGAIDGFRARYGCWPVRVRIFPESLRNLREELFSAGSFAELSGKIQLLAGPAPMVAEDDSGNRYSYGSDGFPPQRPNPDARQWLGVEPDRHQ